MALTKLPKNAFGTGSVDTSKIEDGTIQAVEVSGTIPADKLSSTQDYSSKTVTLPDTSVTSDQLAGSIANAKLSNSTFTVRGTSRSLGDSFSLGVNVDWQSVITGAGSSNTAVSGQGYFIDTTSDVHTVTLPASASIGDFIAIKDYAGTFATNNLTIARNGHNIQGVANDSLISTNRASLLLVYVDSTKGWIYVEESNVASLLKATFTSATGGTITESGDYKIHTFTGDGCFVVSTLGNSPVNPLGGPAIVDYLVIAGGGGGGGGTGGGGGAGGYRESKSPVSGCYSASPLANPTGLTISATTYPVSVGAGGGGAGDGGNGGKGSNSSFSTITSAGGGGGSHRGPHGPGMDGGSGGGAGYSPGPAPTSTNPAGVGNSPPVSPPQGNPGGTTTNTGPPHFTGAGGGGAGGSGSSINNSPNGGPGGNGVTTSINGSPVTRAGGGGGGTNGTTATGGSGGGGPSVNGQNGTSGTANTGSGGGAAGTCASKSSGSGGKGIVIIRYKFQ